MLDFTSFKSSKLIFPTDYHLPCKFTYPSKQEDNTQSKNENKIYTHISASNKKNDVINLKYPQVSEHYMLIRMHERTSKVKTIIHNTGYIL